MFSFRRGVLGSGLALLIIIVLTRSAAAEPKWVNNRLCSEKFGCEWLLPLPGNDMSSDEYQHTTAREEQYRSTPAWDIKAPVGTKVYAMAEGDVILDGCLGPTEYASGLGCRVAIKHADGYISVYAHFQEEDGGTLVKEGQHVTKFTVIGHVGLTGQTSSAYPHVHWFIRKGEGKQLQAWQNLNNKEFFDIDQMEKCFYDRQCTDASSATTAVDVSYPDEPAEPGDGTAVNVSSTSTSNASLKDLLMPGWLFGLLFTVTLVTSIMALSSVLYFVWRWFGDPIFRRLPHVDRDRQMIHMRSVLFQRVALAFMLLPVTFGALVGFSMWTIKSPQARPAIAQLVSWSQNGVTLSESGITTSSSNNNATLVSFTAGGGSIAWLPKSVEQWNGEIAKTARNQEELEAVKLIMTIESCGFVKAKSPGAGAQGLMQIMPGTASGIATQHGVPDPGEGIYEPTINIKFGTWYYQEQYDRFGSYTTAAIAYNGGPGRAQTYVASGLSAIPEETQRYNRWFSGMWAERRQQTSPTFDAWLAAGGSVLCKSAESQLSQQLAQAQP